LAVRFHKTHRQTYRKAYPATDFSNGITNLTKISASERLGLVFLFVILAHYDEGWDIFEAALDKHTSCTFRDVLNLWECMLCFDSWMNRATFWDIENSRTEKHEFHNSIVTFLEMCKERIPTVTIKKGKEREKNQNAENPAKLKSLTKMFRSTILKQKLSRLKCGSFQNFMNCYTLWMTLNALAPQ
jgi:hypothetical protein